jgi:competence protein ComEA
MFKKLLFSLLALFTAAAFAAVDVNKADQAALESIKGIGPSISGKIIDERKKGPFKDWPDLVDRVSGIGEGNAAKFSTEGLTVNGAAFKGAPAKPAAAEPKKDGAKKDDKPAKADDKKAAKATVPADEKAAAPKASATKASAPKAVDAKASAPKAADAKASAPKSADKK